MGLSSCTLVLADKHIDPETGQYCPNYYKNASSIKNLIAYICRTNGEGIRYYGTINLGNTDTTKLAKKIKCVQKYYKKTSGRRMYHYILSFNGNYADEDIKQLFLVAHDIIRLYFYNTQIVFAIHEDTDHLHVHFVFSSVLLNGYKWNCRKRDFYYLKRSIEQYADIAMCDCGYRHLHSKFKNTTSLEEML